MQVADARNIPNWNLTSGPSVGGSNDGSNDHTEAVPREVKLHCPRFEHFEHGVVRL